MDRREFLKQTLGAAAFTATMGLPAFGFGNNGFKSKDQHIHDVIIVGGGMSGLTTAYLMKDHDILLLEKEPNLGGRILGNQWEGLHYSMGASYLGEPDKDMRSFFKGLGIKARPVPPPNDAIAYNGKIYPDDYSSALFATENNAIADYARISKKLYQMAVNGIEKAVYNADIDTLAKYEKYDQFSLKQWLDQNHTANIVQKYIDTENRGLFGTGNNDFSFLFSIPEMAFNLYDDSSNSDPQKLEKHIKKELKSMKIPDFHTYRPRVGRKDASVWTFPKGMLELVWAVENNKKLKGKLRGGANVKNVTVNRDRTVTVTYKRNGQRHTARAHAVVMATPATMTMSIVKNGLSANVKEALRSVHYTTYVTMALFLSQRLFRNAWNISCPDCCFTTLNDAVRMEVDYDYNGKSILGVAMPAPTPYDQSLISQPDNVLVDRALKDIERYFPGVRKKVLGYDLHRFQHAFPVFAPGYGDVLWELHKDKTTRGPVFLAGDYTVYPTLGGAAASAWRAYEQVAIYADTL